MSLARALTKRMRPQEDVPAAADSNNMNRAYHARRTDKPIDRSKISLPLELISSSNALAYEAPDVQQMQAEFAAQANMAQQSVPDTPSSSASSRKSYEDSVSSPGLSSASSVTSADMSRESSPTTQHKPSGGFFFDNVETTIPAPAMPAAPAPPKEASVVVTPAEESTPNVPKRALSHTKQTHQALARQRSQRVASPPASAKFAPATRSSLDMFAVKPEADHPFGAELEKVNELAEEFGMKDVQILDEESQYLVDHGYLRFSAEDYMSEIEPLYAMAYPPPPTWF